MNIQQLRIQLCYARKHGNKSNQALDFQQKTYTFKIENLKTKKEKYKNMNVENKSKSKNIVTRNI